MTPSKRINGISKALALAVMGIIAIGIISTVIFFGASPGPQEITKEPTKEQSKEVVKEPEKEVAKEQPKEVTKEQPKETLDPRAAALKSAVEDYLRIFEEKDIPKLMTFYTQTGTFAEWKGQAGAFSGKYDGFGNVRILFASVAGNTDNIKIQMSEYKADIAGDSANVTFHMNNAGHGKLVGDFTMEIEVAQKWLYQDSKWLLQNDQYNFKVFKTELVAEGTVFPIHWRKLGDFSFWNERVKALFP